MLINRKYIPRRTFLRGAGAALALPMLDAMTPALSAEGPRPIRLGFMQVPNGIMNLKNEWSPKAEGPLEGMTRIMEPLADHKDRLVVMSGLDSQQAAGLNFEVGGDHPRACTAWLTGTHCKILDAILSDVRRLRGKLGGADRGKIDQYLEAIRDVERRMQLADKQGSRDMPQIEGPAGAPEVFSEYFKLMADLMVLAWQTDMTRVITFMMGHEMSGRAYPEVGFGDAHHPCTHHQGDPEKIEKTVKINTFHTKMLSYYLDKLRSTSDGDGSLLDHSMILYGAGLSDANLHLYTDLSLLLIAGGVGGIKGGMHVRYPNRTPMANLLLTMLDKADVPYVSKLGDSTGRLDLPTT